ncbi:MAG: caspase family protein [Thermoplasmatales archaeon]|nr:caspase family protein [Thermoplasmatales archaeon]
MDKKKIIAVILIVAVVSPVIFIYFEEETVEVNKKPVVEIVYPRDGATVSKIVTISGSASDPDGDDNLLRVEIRINGEWNSVEGNTKWSYEWKTYDLDDDIYTVNVRSWDGADYSEIEEIKIRIQNPEVIESDSHKWAIFMAASNFPEDNESKLGNGALNLAEKMAAYFIEDLGYPTDNIIILFDDGWIRGDNGYGEPFETLQQRKHRYDITYGGATKGTVVSSLEYVVDESNKFEDSEVFVWIASHGCGDDSKKLFGGKILDRSAIFLWDDTMSDADFGGILVSLKSDKTCVIVDACYSGGFADKTIFNLPEFFLLKSNIPNSGRVVMTGASKFRLGYASTIEGPLFSQLWFNGIESGDADGFKPSIFDMGRPTKLKMFKDGKVSVEEAFYYAKYILRTDKALKDFSKMEPQINDQYPRSGPFGSKKGMILGE